MLIENLVKAPEEKIRVWSRHQEDALQNQKKVRFTEDDLIQYIK